MARNGLGDGLGDGQKWCGRPELVWEALQWPEMVWEASKWPEMVSEAPKWRHDPRYGLGVNK